MAKKAKNINTIFDEMIYNIKSQMASSAQETQKSYIPDIITFCYDPHYLNLKNNPGNPISLYPLQEVAIKGLYRGTTGNEHLILTAEERQLLKNDGLDYVIDKFDSDNIFRECVLVWGRRGGKDLTTSIIAAYETMRLLEIPGGNPFSYFKIKEGNPIYILTVASSDPQAKVLFNDIKTLVLNSPYFQDKIGDNGKAVDSSSIYLLTPSDRETNKEREKKGFETIRGNVVILAGHSNSDTLRGKRAFSLLLDEVATYKTTSGSAGGDAILSSLAPSTNDFRVYWTDENGVKKDRLESKIISISSPRGKDGIFWKLYNESFDPVLGAQRFAMRAPTWKVNLQHTKESLRRDYPFMSEQEFSMEFGAEFAGLEGEKFIPAEYVDRAISVELGQRAFGQRGISYFAHLDPAATSHNYALAVIHVEPYIKTLPLGETGKYKREQRKRYVVDHLKVWTPIGSRGIDFEMVDDYVINLAKLFRFVMVSYDAFESRQSMQRLRKNGIPSKITQFRKRYKVEIYRHLENLLIAGDITLPSQGPHAKLLEMELKNLKRKWTASGGFSIGPNEEAEVRTDDLCFAPDTLVLMGDKTYKEIKDICEGEFVTSALGNIKKVTKVFKNNSPEEMFLIRPIYSIPIVCTGNHPFDIGDGNYKTASQLSLSDKLVVNLRTIQSNDTKFDLGKYSVSDNIKWTKDSGFTEPERVKCNNANGKWHNRFVEITKDFALLAGLYIAEGSCHHHGISFAFNSNENYLHEKTAELIKKIFGVDPVVDICINNTTRVSVDSQIIKRFFRDLFGYEHAIGKQIPSVFMESDNEILIELLKGMFYGDGSYDNRQICFTTTSVKLALQIRYILFRIGVVGVFSVSKRKGKKTQIHGRELTYNADLYNIRIMWFEHYNILSNYFELGLQKNASKFHKIRFEFFKDEVRMDIRKIEKIHKTDEFVYNLEVEDDHSYITQVNVHNCDALSGACGVAMGELDSAYTKSSISYAPLSREEPIWKIGYGTYTDLQFKQMRNKLGINR